jgi:hypothetical protein
MGSVGAAMGITIAGIVGLSVVFDEFSFVIVVRLIGIAFSASLNACNRLLI